MTLDRRMLQEGTRNMQKERKVTNIHLFAMPSFITGIARILDPFGTLNTYNTSSSGEEADYDALRSDWKAVGDDIRYAIRSYKRSLK